ncbi:hypothetical protein R6V09_44760 [Streptomyces sp. W16]|uniref:hypothetical protein n=1 Tax=Streptomyces sp. W16 TaxID=3076631 RepID=UPI00295B1D96|nr:hypothetical protein [Streptomyces sp. W16]MDV9177230.1 hypothetical protein [Streptomyces sp. W16]
MRPKAAAAGIALLAALTAGCTAGRGSTADTSPSAATPSGYTEMQQKVAAAESALTQADKDAARDASR